MEILLTVFKQISGNFCEVNGQNLVAVCVWQRNKHIFNEKFFSFLPNPHRVPRPLFQMLYSSQHTESAGSSQRVAVTSPAGVEVTSEKPGKKKSKTAANVVLTPDPLDQTCIHPESYNIAMR